MQTVYFSGIRFVSSDFKPIAMKRFLILIVLLTFIQSALFAQTKNSAKPETGYKPFKNGKTFAAGIKLSPNISWMKPDAKGYESNGILFRPLTWGFMLDFQFMDNYYISTGFDVRSCGGKLKYKDTIGGDIKSSGMMERTFKLRYVEIPLSFKMKTRQFGYITYYGQIGFAAGFNLNADSDDEFTYGNAQIYKQEDKIKDNVAFMRLSMVLSAGMEYSLGGSTSLFTGLTFNNGFTNILKGQSNVPPGVGLDAIGNSLELNIGIIF